MGGTATPVTWAPKPRGTPPLLGSQVVNHGFTFPGSSFTDRACGEGKRGKTRNIPERGWGWGPLHCRVPLKQTQATSPRQSRAGKAETRKRKDRRRKGGERRSDGKRGSSGGCVPERRPPPPKRGDTESLLATRKTAQLLRRSCEAWV